MLASLLLASSVATPWLSDDASPGQGQVADESRWVLSSGVSSLSGKADGAAFGFEYRWPYERDPWWGIEELAPIAGVLATTEGSLYAYGGWRYDWDVGSPWRVTPSLSAGLYEQGDGFDLGNAIEFRSSVELSRSIGETTRLGLTFFHLSNAGLSSRNPGTNGLTLNISWSPGAD